MESHVGFHEEIKHKNQNDPVVIKTFSTSIELEDSATMPKKKSKSSNGSSEVSDMTTLDCLGVIFTSVVMMRNLNLLFMGQKDKIMLFLDATYKLMTSGWALIILSAAVLNNPSPENGTTVKLKPTFIHRLS